MVLPSLPPSIRRRLRSRQSLFPSFLLDRHLWREAAATGGGGHVTTFIEYLIGSIQRVVAGQERDRRSRIAAVRARLYGDRRSGRRTGTNGHKEVRDSGKRIRVEDVVARHQQAR